MVALQPDLEQVLELPVLRNVPRGQVAMVVKYRLRLGKLVIKPRRRARAQEEIVVDELHRLVGYEAPPRKSGLR